MPLLFIPPAIVFHQPPAAPAPNTNAQSDYETWDADRLFQFGSYLLRSGRNFPRAIQVFEIAVKKQPENVDYQLALGCACASRFASVSEAARQIKNAAYYEETYPKRRETWEAAQKDAKSPLFQKPAPAPPQACVTPDDARPFALSPDESRSERLRLAKQSLAAFDAAKQLTPTLPAERKADADYVRGWGLWTLRRDGAESGVVRDAPPAPPKNGADKSMPPPREFVVISPDTVTQCFHNAADTDDKKRDYFVSLGFSYVPDYLDGKRGEWGSEVMYWEAAPHYKKEVMDKAIAAFERALADKPRDFDTLYSLSMICVQQDCAAAVGYLEKAANRQENNAALWYLLAEMQFRQADTLETPDKQMVWQKKAVASVERGNTAPSYQINALPLPIPPALRAAWQYQKARGYGNDVIILYHLASRTDDYMKREDAQNRTDNFLQAASALMAMGVKVASGLAEVAQNRYDLSDLNQSSAMESSRVVGGIVDCYYAYDAVQNSQKARPDAQKARFLEKNAGLLDYIKSIDKEVVGGN